MPIPSYRAIPLSKAQILALYTNLAPLHFPPDELRPLENLENLFSRGGYKGLGLYECSKPRQLLGYALFIRVPDFPVMLLDFYAILEEYRCLGLGGIFLREIKAHYQNVCGILLETEAVSAASSAEEKILRERRNAFYEKNGAGKTNVSSAVFGVSYSIYFLPTHNPSDTFSVNTDAFPDTEFVRRALEKIYRFMLPDKLYKHVSIS